MLRRYRQLSEQQGTGMRSTIAPAVFAAAQLISFSACADGWSIEHVTLIDGLHAAQPDTTVSIDGDRISGIAPSAMAHPKGRRIDGTGKFLVPGLIDVHIHLRGGFDVGGKLDAETAPPNRDEGIAALASYLYSGVTTVFEAGNRAATLWP